MTKIQILLMAIALNHCSQSSEQNVFYLDRWEICNETKTACTKAEYPDSNVYSNIGLQNYAIYTTRFTIPDSLKDLPLVFAPGEIDDADEVYLNGQLIGKTGNLESKNDGKGIAYDRFRIYSLPSSLLRENNHLEIRIRTLFHHQGGIYYNRPLIGLASAVTENYYHDQYRQAILAAIFLMTGLYFLALFLRRKSGVENAGFFVTATLFAIYFFFRTHLKYEFIDSVLLAKRIEFVSLYFLLPAGAQFMVLFFRAKEWYYRLPVYITFLLATFNSMMLFKPDPALWFDLLQYVSYPGWILAACSSVILTINRALQKEDPGLRRDAIYLGLAFTVVVLSAVNDALYVNSTTHSIELSQYGFLTFVAGLGWILSNRFVRLHEDIEYLNANLEQTVEHRTKDLKRAIDQIDLEMKLAANVQNSLMPEKLTVNGISIYGYNKPSTAVGGDIYDAIETDQGTLVYLADASGHGVPAALITMLTRTVFQNEARDFQDLPELLNRINIELIRHIRTDDYVTCTAVLIKENGMAEVASAGHLPGFYMDRNQPDTVETTSGFFLGMLEQTIDFDTVQIDLSAKQRFLLYTDGISEARLSDSTEQEEFGLDRIKKLFEQGRFLDADSSIQSIAKWVTDSCEPLTDDATLLMIERSEPLDHAAIIERYLLNGQKKEALEASYRALKDTRSSSKSHVLAARSALVCDRPALAFNWMNRASKRWPDSAEIWSTMGDSLSILNRKDLAEKAYRKALRFTYDHSRWSVTNRAA